MVLDNLLDNAVKFGDKEPMRITVRAERQDEEWLRVAVTDNGPGIPHEYTDRVFDEFVQVEDLATGKVPGLGLGLCMAKQVVEAYGGTITIESCIGQGSTVSFVLPGTAGDAASSEQAF
jgi:signal transduction histidine kinase